MGLCVPTLAPHDAVVGVPVSLSLAFGIHIKHSSCDPRVLHDQPHHAPTADYPNIFWIRVIVTLCSSEKPDVSDQQIVSIFRDEE
jgi:hypothetical protein